MNKYFFNLCLSILGAIAPMNASEQNEYQIKILVGKQIEEIAPFLIDGRLIYFCGYPFLYNATLEDERIYYTKFSNYKDAAVAAIYYDGNPVGLLTGSSVVSFENDYGNKHGFKETSLNANNFYYLGEAIVSPEHRKKRLSSLLLEQLEKWAATQGYTHGCLVSESYESHPLKPHDYKEPDSILRSLGFEKSNIYVTSHWETFQPDGSSQYQAHSMPYWIKEFKQ